MKLRKRILSGFLAALLSVSTLGSTAMIGFAEENTTKKSSDYLAVYEDFNDYEIGNTYTLDFTDASEGNDGTAEIVKKSEDDNWLKYTGINRKGHKYDTARTDFSGNPSDYNGVAAYIKAVHDTNICVMLKSNGGLTRTAWKEGLKATLVSTTGEEQEVISTGKGFPVSGGFEGWIVVEKSQLKNADGWETGAFDGITDLKEILSYTLEATYTTGELYVDNYSFVTNLKQFIKAYQKEIKNKPLEPSGNYLKIYENFDAYTTENTYTLDFIDVSENNNGTIEVVQREENNQWLKITGWSRLGHKYDNPRTDISGNVADYDGVAVYVKAEADSTAGILLKSNGGLTRTCYNEGVKATLVSKSGKSSSVTTSERGMVIPTGFEGWIVVEKSQLKNADGWETGAFSGITDINQIWSYTLEVVDTTGILYADNYAFVTNTADFIRALEKEGTTKPEPDNPNPTPTSSYLMKFEDFEGYDANSNYLMDYTSADGGQYVATATVVAKDTDSKWLKLSGNNRAGHIYATPKTGVDGAPADYNGVAVYVKSEKASTFNVLLRSSGLTRTVNNVKLAYALVSKDGTLTQAQAENGVPLPEGFEGWVIFHKTALTDAPGWVGNGAFTNITNLNQIDVFTVEVTDTEGAFYVDDLSFVTDTTAFLNSIANTTPEPEPDPEPDPSENAYKSGYITADNGNVLYFENFDSWTDEYDYVLDYIDMDPSKTSTYDVVTKSGSDRWLKINGYSVWGHKYADDGWPRKGIEANIKDYTGFSMYVKTKEVANFNLILAMGSTARFSTQTASNLTYTLISKTGKSMVAETKYGVGGITLPAGFEGWIVLDKYQFAAPGGWPDSVADWNNLPNGDVRFLNFFIPYVDTTGEFYFDSFGFVKDLSAFVKAHSSEAIKALTPETAGNQISLENFDKNPTNAYAEAKRLAISDRGNGNKWWKPATADESGFSVVNSPITPAIGYNGFSMYVETVKDASFALFLNKGETSFRTTAKGKISYTLIGTDGSFRDVTVSDGYLKIKAGFKGYIVIDKSMFQNAGWGDTGLTINDVKGAEISRFYTYLSGDPEGKDTSWRIAIDDICFVQDTAKLRSDLTNGKYKSTLVEAGDAKGDQYSYLLEDFSEMPEGVLDTFYNGITIGSEGVETGGIEIVTDESGHKWWKQTKAGYTGFQTAYKAPKSVGTKWDGLAFYVKVDMKEATDPSMSLGGVLHHRILNAFPKAKDQYTTANFSTQNQGMTTKLEYLTIDTERNQETKQNMGGIQFDNPFEGWIYVDKSMLTDTWLDNRPMDTIPADMMDNFTLSFSQFNQGSVSIRELRLVTDKEGFINQNAKPADLVYEFEYDEIEMIPAEDFQYIKDNDISMHITITDGYPIYEWHFKGSDIDTPKDFNPEILFDDEISDIQKKHELYRLLEDEVARAFMLNEMPGKATLSVSSNLKYEFEQELFLYRYDAVKGNSEKVSDDVYIVNEADMIELSAEEEGIYYFAPTSVKLKDTEAKKTNTEKGGLAPLTIGLIAAGAVVVAGGAGVGVTVFLKKKKTKVTD